MESNCRQFNITIKAWNILILIKDMETSWKRYENKTPVESDLYLHTYELFYLGDENK
jgi:hypothetical protein